MDWSTSKKNHTKISFINSITHKISKSFLPRFRIANPWPSFRFPSTKKRTMCCNFLLREEDDVLVSQRNWRNLNDASKCSSALWTTHEGKYVRWGPNGVRWVGSASFVFPLPLADGHRRSLLLWTWRESVTLQFAFRPATASPTTLAPTTWLSFIDGWTKCFFHEFD